MTRRLSLSALLLLGAAMLSGCANDPDAAARAEAQSQHAVQAPGGFVAHLNSSVTSEVGVSSH
jgi:starvation-inducible outer membrane lipoprotein